MRQPDCSVNTVSDVQSTRFKATRWLQASVMTVGDQVPHCHYFIFCLLSLCQQSSSSIQECVPTLTAVLPMQVSVCCCVRITRTPTARNLAARPIDALARGFQRTAAFRRCFTEVFFLCRFCLDASGVCGTRLAGSARGLGICNTAKGSLFSASAEEAFCLPSTVECDAELAAAPAPGWLVYYFSIIFAVLPIK
jgi:hypothetical protein